MTDHYSNPDDILKKVSRRYLLRNSAIAATGAVLLPSFITGCTKDAPAAGGAGNLGGVQLTPEQLALAAANLTRMRAWITDLYPLCIEYEDAVFHALASTPQNGNWTNFIIDIFIDIAFAVAAAAAIASGGAAAVPAFAILSAILHDWGLGKDKPNNLDDVFATFLFGHNAMQLAMEQKLSSLVDPANNYSNLTNAWKDKIEFNGATYTIEDLASSNFPGLGDEYNKLQSASYTYFKKSLWNLVIMKCCRYYRNYAGSLDTDKTPAGVFLQWAQTTFYPQNPGVYLRANLVEYRDDGIYWEYYYWNLGIDGYPFPDDASKILFIDDTPGHVINPDGLFSRSYLFEQFSLTKPDFSQAHELGNYQVGNLNPAADDWEFTGGLFQKITH